MGTGVLAAPSLADTVARANGRCSLKENSYEAFNGYCTVKPWRGAPAVYNCSYCCGGVWREHGEIMWLNVDSMWGDVGIT